MRLFMWLSAGILALVAPLGVSAQAPPASSVSLCVVVQSPDACNLSPERKLGALVTSVRPGGGADRAGIKAGDVVLNFGGADIQDWRDLPKSIQRAHVGDQIEVTVKRGEAVLTEHVQFTQADVPAPIAATTTPAAPPTGVPVPASIGCLASPYRVLPLPPDAAQRAAALVGDSSVSLVGDVLTILHRDSGESVRLFGSLQLPMTLVPRTNVWLALLEMRGWERTFFSYQFLGSTKGSTLSNLGVFHGTDAPALPTDTAHLQGQLTTTHLHSQVLNEDRDITVYLPPRSAAGLPVLYMTDGQSVESFARVLEPLMLNHQIPAFAVIGEHAVENAAPSGAFDPQTDIRTREYVPGVDKDRFDRHMLFFTEELLPWASRTYAVSAQRAGRALFGFSSGAAFGLQMAVVHPELFGAVLPFSAGVPLATAVPKSGMPRLYLAAGELEPPFAAATRRAREVLRDAGAEVIFTSYPSGHDILMWELALVNYAPQVFPPGG